MSYLITIILLAAVLMAASFYFKKHPDVVKSLNKTVADTSLPESIEKRGKEILAWIIAAMAILVYIFILEPQAKEAVKTDSGAAMMVGFLKWLDILTIVCSVLDIITRRLKKKNN